MTIWHIVLYSMAAILALRSFVQLVTNYRNEFEHAAVKDHLTRMQDELEVGSQPEAAMASRMANKVTAPGKASTVMR